MNVVVSDQAHRDLDEIETWYFEQGEHLPDLFYDEFEALLIFIGRHPTSGIKLKSNYRMFLMERFPHYVIAEIKNQSIEVLHEIHPRRHPGLRFKRIK
jgi:plasmid stabilization system protein ParE